MPLLGAAPPLAGLPVRLVTGGGIAAVAPVHPSGLGDLQQHWRAVRVAGSTPGAVDSGDGWTRVLVGASPGGARAALVLRDADWLLLRSALDLHDRPASRPQDAPRPWVVARHLARLDGLDGSAADGRWGRLALEVVSVRVPGRLADTTTLHWTASWGPGGRGAGSEGRAEGDGDHQSLTDLGQQRFVVQGRPFRVRTLPDWEREDAAHDLLLPPARVLAWPVVALRALLAHFDDLTPSGSGATPLPAPGPSAPPADARVQDAAARPSPGPQDAR